MEVDADDEEEMDEEEYERLMEEARLLAEAEAELLRNLRLAEISRKKEILIERYLRIARVMINHRKKNIYLQDYLYKLAARKGVLRGDPQINIIHPSSVNTEEEAKNSKAIEHEIKREKKHQAAMSARFLRFLLKTGHLDEQLLEKDKERDRQDERHKRHKRHEMLERMIRRSGHGAPYCPLGGSGEDCYGKAALSKKRNKKKSPLLAVQQYQGKMAAGKHAKGVPDASEKQRSKMAKKRQTIEIATLLHRLYNGTGLMPPERQHLVHFVGLSVKAQNLAKWKAARRQMKNKHVEVAPDNKTGITRLNHQWVKSLERIRELRLKKAKLEHEHRLELLKKVRHWRFWDKKVLAVLTKVYNFIANMGSKAIMTKAENEAFSLGLDLFHKQLHSLFNGMLKHLIKMFKAKSMLYMTQRRANDAEGSSGPGDDFSKGFSIADFERMKLETDEARQKLEEKQKHLLEQHEKLKKYMSAVATSYQTKQGIWTSLEAGKYDMKQLWDLCSTERDNLLAKLRELNKHRKHHRERFMQISLLENKRCLTNFAQVEYNVHNLQNSQRDLRTQTVHTQSILRVLNVRFNDIVQRLNANHVEQLEKRRAEQVKMQKEKIRQHLNPRVPNTIYSMHSGGCGSSTAISFASNDAFLKASQDLTAPSVRTLAKDYIKKKTKLPPV